MTLERPGSPRASEAGTSLVETLIAMFVLTVGAIGMAALFVYGMQSTISSPNELLATQKASEVIESVFSARDTHTLTWAQLRNTSNDGVFGDDPMPLWSAGADGILGTADDTGVETVTHPGPDGLFGTADDVVQVLDAFTRQIRITDVSAVLRTVTVTITYRAGPDMRTYTLTALLSAWA